MGTSKISVDLNQRTFEIEVPDENVGSVLDQLVQLFDKLPPAAASELEKSVDRDDPHDSVSSENGAVDNDSERESKPKRKRGAAKGPTKIKAYELVDLGLTQPQRQEMQKFFQEKSPHGQNDQVAVLAVKLKEFKGKSDFSVDEIHSAFKVVNKPTPRNLTAVLGNMKRDGRGGYSDSKLIVNSFTEDHVEFHMTSGPKEKK